MNLATRWLLPLAGPVGFVLVWWGICEMNVVRPVLLPTPFATFAYMFDALLHGSMLADSFVTLSRVVVAFLIGALLATTIWLTGDLWLSVGIHAGVVLAEDLVFSVPDSGVTYTGHLLTSSLGGPPWLSGGDAGPEGSVLALPIFAALLALLWIVYRRRPAALDG